MDDSTKCRLPSTGIVGGPGGRPAGRRPTSSRRRRRKAAKAASATVGSEIMFAQSSRSGRLEINTQTSCSRRRVPAYMRNGSCELESHCSLSRTAGHLQEYIRMLKSYNRKLVSMWSAARETERMIGSSAYGPQTAPRDRPMYLD